MTNKDIILFFDKIGELRGKKLPVKLSFAIKVNTEKINPLANAYNEQVSEIRKKYENENPNQLVEELTELQNTEVSIEVQKIDMGTLEKCELEQFDNLTLGEIEALAFMIQ